MKRPSGPPAFSFGQPMLFHGARELLGVRPRAKALSPRSRASLELRSQFEGLKIGDSRAGPDSELCIEGARRVITDLQHPCQLSGLFTVHDRICVPRFPVGPPHEHRVSFELLSCI